MTLIAVALIAASCGDSTSDAGTSAPTTTATTAPAATTAAPTTTTTAAPTTTAPPAMRPVSMVSASLDLSYNTAGDFDAAVMGFAEGDVIAEWFSADGFYVVLFSGLDLNAVDPLCPGASVLTGAGYEFVANAPSPGADCSTFPTLTTDPDVRVLACDGMLSFRTAIPADSEGTLLGTLERPVDGGIMGVTSGVDVAAGTVPEIDTALLDC